MKRVLIVAALALVALYLGDYFWVQHRMANQDTANLFSSVEFYYATQLKSGKMEIFFDQPGTEICVHSLFPQAGDRPCWYVHRVSNMRVR